MRNHFRIITGIFFTLFILGLIGSPIVEKIENPFIGFIVSAALIYISYKLGFKLTNKLFKYKKISSYGDDEVSIKKLQPITKTINSPNYSLDSFDEFIVLDFETTGLDPTTDKIIEVSALKYKDGILIDEFHTLINPKIKIPHEITEINGITNAIVKNKPTIEEILPKLLDFIGELPIVAHNAPFDAKFLKYNVLRHYGEDNINNTFIDTLAIARKLFPNLRNHKLETIKKHLKMDVDSHRAYDDTLVTAQIYLDYIKLCKNRTKGTNSTKETIKEETELTSFSELDFPPRSKKEKPGYYQGKHYTEYVDLVKKLKKAGEYDKAEKLLLSLVEAVESESKKENCGVAPWYYEQLAIIYRKQGNLLKEFEILERFSKQKHAPGSKTPTLIERFESVRNKVKMNQ